jgi:Icc-related predicted phosphoesterase
VNILALSDRVEERLYSLISAKHFENIDLILGCGDMPYDYLENVLTLLNVPLYYVPGNHDPEYNEQSPLSHAEGASNLDLKLVREKTFLIAGFGGSIRYRPDGINQYNQFEAFLRAYRLLPGLIWNRIHYGRFLDILITHSPPFGVNDEDTQAHQGLKALGWLIRFARPRYHFHGHTHFFRRNLAPSETTIGITRVVNVFPYKIIEAHH